MAPKDQLSEAVSAIADRLRDEKLWIELWFIRQSDGLANDIAERSWLRIYQKTSMIQLVSMILTASVLVTGRAVAQANGSNGSAGAGGPSGGSTTLCDNETAQWLIFFILSSVLTVLFVAILYAAGIGGVKRAVSPSQSRREEGAGQQKQGIYAGVSTAAIFIFTGILVQNIPFDVVTTCIPTL